METFWADADFEVVEKNFHPTISHIRKGLNSNHAFKQNFLIYRDGDYQLNSDFAYRIDMEEFDKLVVEAENARRVKDTEACELSLNRAAALYRGEFMRGCYDSWVENQRAYYRQQYLATLETLADIKERAGDWVNALQLAQKILTDDPYREDIHCKAMRAQAALGNRVAIKEQFESLRRVLHKELGVEPSAETRRLYKELIK
jgi:DNA-binding SARP family transcriptional activator